MKRTILLALAMALCGMAGCGITTGLQAQKNRNNMLKLSTGMSKDELLSVMGKPYQTENYGQFDIWSYRTDMMRNFETTEDDLTPIVFEDGNLIGWGSRFAHETVRKYELRLR